jgi:hypothetical protein
MLPKTFLVQVLPNRNYTKTGGAGVFRDVRRARRRISLRTMLQPVTASQWGRGSGLISRLGTIARDLLTLKRYRPPEVESVCSVEANITHGLGSLTAQGCPFFMLPAGAPVLLPLGTMRRQRGGGARRADGGQRDRLSARHEKAAEPTPRPCHPGGCSLHLAGTAVDGQC